MTLFEAIYSNEGRRAKTKQTSESVSLLTKLNKAAVIGFLIALPYRNKACCDIFLLTIRSNNLKNHVVIAETNLR
jgi:hypothetical protein